VSPVSPANLAGRASEFCPPRKARRTRLPTLPRNGGFAFESSPRGRVRHCELPAISQKCQFYPIIGDDFVQDGASRLPPSRRQVAGFEKAGAYGWAVNDIPSIFKSRHHPNSQPKISFCGAESILLRSWLVFCAEPVFLVDRRENRSVNASMSSTSLWKSGGG
jgi:hypothetical protein